MRWPLRLDVFFLQRLDFIFSTLGDFGFERTCETLKHTMGSDHVPVVMEVGRKVDDVGHFTSSTSSTSSTYFTSSKTIFTLFFRRSVAAGVAAGLA